MMPRLLPALAAGLALLVPLATPALADATLALSGQRNGFEIPREGRGGDGGGGRDFNRGGGGGRDFDRGGGGGRDFDRGGGRPAFERPPRPDRPAFERPPRPDRPGTERPPRPDRPDFGRPDRPPVAERPPRPDRPDIRPPRPDRPDVRPPRPDRPDVRPPRPRPPFAERPPHHRPGYWRRWRPGIRFVIIPVPTYEVISEVDWCHYHAWRVRGMAFHRDVQCHQHTDWDHPSLRYVGVAP
jgi:hypothetical protein